jgi:steroid 5-alpha reductase family enzyme
MSAIDWFPLGLGAVLLAALFLVLWLVQRRTGDAGIVDAGWAGSLVLLGVLYAALGHGDPARRLLVAAMALLWAGRLTLHIVRDRLLGHVGEDGRYRRIRAERGDSVQGFFFVFFQAQGAFALLLSLPFLGAAMDARPAPAASDLAALGLFVVGVLGESIADAQLARFRRDPANRGKTCRVGLWRYSRHPNYFFEWLVWCAWAVLALPGPLGALALLSPLVMLWLIVFVTGIPPTEAQALASRGDDYRNYQRTTSPFLPWFPKETRP